MSGRARPIGHGDNGQDLVEFALVTPLLLVIILVLAEFAVVILQYNAVADAARQGARCGVVARGSAAQIEAAALAGAEETAAALGLRSADLTVDVSLTGPDAYRLAVQVSYDVRLLTAPLIQAIGGDSWEPFTLRATTSMIRE